MSDLPAMTNGHPGAQHRSAPARFPAQLWLVLIAFGYLYLSLFVLPGTPIYLDGDQTFFWEYARRMLHGQRIYRDFFQFTPPGTDLYYLALFKLFGARLWAINAGVLLAGVALTSICFSIARRLMADATATLAALLFLVVAYSTLLDATHHWFSLLAVLCAVRVLLPERTPLRTALAGILLGCASFFTQTAGAMGLLAMLLFLAWERWSAQRPWRRVLGLQLLLAAAFALTLGLLSAPLLAGIGWKQLWYFQVSYPRHYLIYHDEGILWQLTERPTGSGLAGYLQRRIVYALLLILYPVTLWRCWRNRRNSEARPLALLALTGLFLLLEVIPRANWTRIYAVSLPAFILLLWTVARSGRWRRPLTVALWVVLVLLGAGKVLSRQRQNRFLADLPAGRAALSAQKYEEFSWLAQHTRPGDLFFQAGWLNVYPPLDLRSPVYMDTLTANEATRPEYVALTLRQLEAQPVQYILWTEGLELPEDPGRPWQDHLGPLRAYLRQHYRLVRAFSSQDQLWQREESLPEE